MSFGKRIKELRSKNSISQEELAKRIGVHTNHLSRYERDLTSPSVDVATKMATTLGVSIDYLVFGELSADDSLTDKQLLSLFQEVQTFSGDDKKLVMTLIDAFITKKKLHKLAE